MSGGRPWCLAAWVLWARKIEKDSSDPWIVVTVGGLGHRLDAQR
nr:hypothetical protein [Kibdelosporangium sp. MJ126-NF4]